MTQSQAEERDDDDDDDHEPKSSLRRIDALAGSVRRGLGPMVATLGEEDPLLRELAREAAETLSMPGALISLVLERTQVFLAQHGVTGALLAAGAIDRDLTFCQFVVRDRALVEICDASRTPWVPQEAVRRFGVQAFLGAPLVVGDEVVGAICVFGTEPRTFVETERAAMTALAARASARLVVLSAAPRQAARGLISVAARPCFDELRNALAPLEIALQFARLAAAELAPIPRLAAMVEQDPSKVAEAIEYLGVLSMARLAFQDLDSCLGDAEQAAHRVTESALALAALILPAVTREPPSAWVAAAAKVAHRWTASIGGVKIARCPDGMRIVAPRTVVVGVLAACLSAVSSAATESRVLGPIALDFEVSGGFLLVRCRCAALSSTEILGCATAMAELTHGEDAISVRADGDALLVAMLCA